MKGKKKMACGLIDQVVNDEGTVYPVKWKDNNTHVMASSEHGKNHVTKCRRWSANQKQHTGMACPQVIQQYNENMDGVDLLDRMIVFYRVSARTHRWTICAIIAYGWLRPCQLLDWIQTTSYQSRLANWITLCFQNGYSALPSSHRRRQWFKFKWFGFLTWGWHPPIKYIPATVEG